MTTIRVAVASTVYMGHSRDPFLMRAPFVPPELLEVLGKMGAAPFMISYHADIPVEEYLPMMDALVVIGGLMASPDFYGEEPTLRLGETFRPRDLFEMDLIRKAASAGKPILAFCRGMQMVNVALGGSLYQNMRSDLPSAYIQHMQKTPMDHGTHSVQIEPGTVLSRIFGDKALVNSMHYEAVKRVAPSLVVTAKSPDGVIEGLQSKDSEQIVTVQWHPEMMWKGNREMTAFFTDFGERVKKQLGIRNDG